jgi:tetratricopeptide (TPR) repeat protein
LHPDAIPEELFIGDGSRHLGIPFQQVTGDAFAFNEAIRVLLTYSLIQRDPCAATLSIHRLVQAVILDAMPEEHQSRWRECVVQVLNETFPERVLQAWTQCGRLLPHVLVCTPWIEHQLISTLQASSLLDKAGAYLLERGQYHQAEPLLIQSLAMREQQLGAEHPDMVKSLNNLTLLSHRQAKYDQVMPLAMRARAICEQSLEVEPPERATNLMFLTIVYSLRSEYQQAASLTEQAVAILEQSLGTQHAETARCLNYLACIYSWQGKYEQAESLFERVLSIFEQSLGILHRRVALHQVEHYLAQGKYEQAKSLCERALAVCKETVGMEHLETAACVSGLARVYLEQGKYEQAKPFFEQLIEIDKQHPEAATYAETAYALHGLARFSQHEGKDEQTEDYYRRALAILEQREGISWLKKQKVQRDYDEFLHRDE